MLLVANAASVALVYRAYQAHRLRQGLFWIAVCWSFLTVVLVTLAAAFAVLTAGPTEVVLSGGMGAGALAALRSARNGFNEWRRLP
jgi:hypothetical protein